MFAFQRSYPERDFDWQGWRKAMADIHKKEAAQDRGPSGCGDGNPTNWTLQGPANVGGRVNTLAVKPGDDLTVLAGFAGGGIFKSIDGGVNWYPVFDDSPYLAIGDITFDPNNANVVYAGTGDPNLPSIMFTGDGVYKSVDAGENWQHIGLPEVAVVSKIHVDPSNSQVLYVAAMGNPHVRDVNRGVYKSTNGGATWQKILFVSDQAGACDLQINPANPQVLYASFWDRIRNNFESLVYGPHARIYKTTDGGANWVQLGGGLPTGIMGRTGLAMSEQNPEKLYAVYVDTLSKLGGLFKTTNGGQSWTSMSLTSLNNVYSNFGWYFGKLRLNPANDEELFLPGVLLWRLQPGSGAWQPGAGGHADSHDLLYTPSGRRYWANDGGVYRSNPGQSVFTRCQNLPTTQLYHTDFNPNHPNTYYVGAQDNGIQKGNGDLINNWIPVFFADGFNCVFSPNDSNTFWVETQTGAIHGTADGGDSWTQGDVGLGFGPAERCNWDAPFFMSVHTAPKRFAATYRVYSTQGNFWSPLSEDLTDGVILEPRFHNISALNESPVLAEKLIAGTTDGNVWRREPTGDWVNITAGLPDRYVTSVHGSPTLANRLYATHSGFRDNVNIPHIHRSDDNGQNWTDISGNLPQIPVNDLLVLPNLSDNYIFAATDAGVYFTANAGQSWARLGGNMPFIPVFDLEINPVRNQIMAATFARGLWTFPLDSIFSQPSAGTVALSGGIKTELGEGVADARVSVQPFVESVSSGLFDISNAAACQPFTLAPYRNDNPLNGVTTFDLALISKHILALEAITSPYKLIAADANKSGSVTTTDIVTLRRLILGIDTVFANNTSWRFVPSAYVFPNPALPFLPAFPETMDLLLQTDPLGGLDFVGIKTGDINNTVIPGLAGAADERTIGEWPLAFQNRDFQTGDPVETVFSGDCRALAGLQFTLRFDPAKLALETVEPIAAGLTAGHFGLQGSGAGLLTFSFDPDVRKTTQNRETMLFRLVFKAKAAGSLAGCFALDEKPTPALVYSLTGAVRKPVLWCNPLQGQGVQVWPNPFNEEGVYVQLPAGIATESVLQVIDNQGKTICTRTISGKEAEQAIHLPANIFKTFGVYFYKINIGGTERVFTGKIIYI